MLSVTEAQHIVLQHAQPLEPGEGTLIPKALGLVLAEDICSDLDLPPWDKALMDGYALRSADVAEGRADLQIIEEVTAGQVPVKTVEPGQATRIMTGAPVPAGADAVVMVERTRTEGDRVHIEDRPRSGQNILPRGQEMRASEVVLSAGARLRPQELGLLAAVGRTTAKMNPMPTVAILPTGDEIVEPHRKPGPGQIRNSNGPMLAAQVVRAGGEPCTLGIAPDKRDELRSLIQEGLKADILILSGGVSAGKLDLVPGVLAELGVTAHFHKVEMKPGKPVLFGTRDSKLVFGLPGNPVSSLVCFELFVRPALRRLKNLDKPLPELLAATLTADYAYRTDRPTYHPAQLQYKDGNYQVTMLPWLGSPDLRSLSRADAFVIVPRGDHHFQAGQRMDVLPVEWS